MSNCKCNTKKPKAETISKLLDNIIEAEKSFTVARLTNGLTNSTLNSIASSMRDKAVHGGRLNQMGERTKISNDFVEGFEKILRKRITKMLEEAS